MGVDYLARKSAKRERKRSGVCFQDPVLKPDELEEGLGDGRASPAQEAKLVSLESRIAAQVVAGDAPAAKVDTPKQAAPKRRKLSTSVALPMRVESGEAERPLPPTSSNDAALPMSPALAQYPTLFQQYMASKGYGEPTPIQSQAWPVLLAGRHVRAVAEPGAGKTLAFLLPAAEMLAQPAARRGGPPTVLVVEPTRELAQQVGLVWRDLARLSGAQAAVIHGGVPKQEHEAAIAAKPHVIIATPGRLLDLVDSGTLDLGSVRYLVLDEADLMLNMGFAPQLERLRASLCWTSSPPPQVALFTATLPKAVQGVASSWLSDPAILSGGPSADSISRSITQVVQVCAEPQKPAKLARHLAAIDAAAGRNPRNPPRVLVFANRLKTVRFLEGLLMGQGRRVTTLHGDRTQTERDAALADFRAGKVQIMVASDVAARGLHIRNLPYVVNYDFPGNLEQYIHRVGRTGRLASDGHAFSFFTRELAPLAAPLIALLEAHGADLDPNLLRVAEAYAVVKQKLGEAERPTRDAVLGELGLKARKKKGKRTATEAAADEEPAVAESLPFIAASKFGGTKPGYYFGKRPAGLGYHLDTAAAAAAAAAATTSGPGQKAAAKGRSGASSRGQQVGGHAVGDAALPGLAVPENKGGAATAARKKAVPGRLRRKLAAAAKAEAARGESTLVS